MARQSHLNNFQTSFQQQLDPSQFAAQVSRESTMAVPFDASSGGAGGSGSGSVGGGGRGAGVGGTATL